VNGADSERGLRYLSPNGLWKLSRVPEKSIKMIPGRPFNSGLLRRRELLFAALWLGVARAEKPLPAGDLLVELREVDAAPSSGWSARSGDAGAARQRPVQQVRVANGAKASVNVGVTRPLQTWQAAPAALLPTSIAPPLSPPGAPAKAPPPPAPGQAMPMAAPDLQWLEAGQQLTVTVRWPGGREPASVVLSAKASRFDPTVAPGSAEPPQRSDNKLETTVLAPLGQWVTLAASGADADDANVVASAQAQAPRVLQLRVSRVP